MTTDVNTTDGTRGSATNPAALKVIADARPTPRAVALVLLPATVLMLAFAFFYVGALHDPTPHHVRVAVIGPAAAATRLSHLPGDPLDARPASSRAAALSKRPWRASRSAFATVLLIPPADTSAVGCFARSRAASTSHVCAMRFASSLSGMPVERFTNFPLEPR